jgi:L-aspartate semialdehyde sulfurtransferase ferredoxin
MKDKSIVRIDPSRCDYCGTCVGVCPADAIELEESMVAVDPEKCTGCLACVIACPFGVPEAA